MGLKENIKIKRTQNKMTLEELASKVGVSRQTIQRYESGIISNIPSDKIEAMAKALKTTPAYLMGWEEIDSHLTGREASDEVYRKFAQNIEKHHGKEKELLEVYKQLSDENRNKTLQYSKGLLSVQQMDTELQLNAAHARTDIEIPEGVDTSDDDIMDDENF
ncbi:MAG TPA: helix-turn-helix domain-containing protein [Candidatus Eisenbergiella pullicola]|nr:helix-turn-helix domain-containing protein [Candidatus Eisenbergiella pullicola]